MKRRSEFKNDLKEIKAAEVEAKKSFDLVTDAKQSLDEVTRRLEAWISQNLGIPDAMKAQKDAQTAYDEASKPLIASMKANPKYMPLVERAAKAELILKTPLTADNANDETLKQTAGGCRQGDGRSEKCGEPLSGVLARVERCSRSLGRQSVEVSGFASTDEATTRSPSRLAFRRKNGNKPKRKAERMLNALQRLNARWPRINPSWPRNVPS